MLATLTSLQHEIVDRTTRLINYFMKFKVLVGLREGFRRFHRLILVHIAATGLEELGVDETEAANKTISITGDTAYERRLIKQRLLLRLQRNDQDAWDKLFQEWSPRIFSYLRYSLPTNEDAEDLLNETFMAAVKSIRKFDEKGAFSTWLYTLAHHKMVDFWREHQQTQVLPKNLSVSSNEIGLNFLEALGCLPNAAQQALLLRYRENMNVKEVALVLGKSYKATESLLSRARVALKKVMNDEDFDREEIYRW